MCPTRQAATVFTRTLSSAASPATGIITYLRIPTAAITILKRAAPSGTPGWQPTQTELDFYECRHGLGYSIITGKKNRLAARLEAVRARWATTGEIDRLVLTNESDAPKSFTVFSYVEFCLWNAVDDSTNFQRNFSTGEVEVEGSTIYHKTEYRERRDHYALYTVNAPVDGFDTSRDAFLGAWRSKCQPRSGGERSVQPTPTPTAGHRSAYTKST